MLPTRQLELSNRVRELYALAAEMGFAVRSIWYETKLTIAPRARRRQKRLALRKQVTTPAVFDWLPSLLMVRTPSLHA